MNKNYLGEIGSMIESYESLLVNLFFFYSSNFILFLIFT